MGKKVLESGSPMARIHALFCRDLMAAAKAGITLVRQEQGGNNDEKFGPRWQAGIGQGLLLDIYGDGKEDTSRVHLHIDLKPDDSFITVGYSPSESQQEGAVFPSIELLRQLWELAKPHIEAFEPEFTLQLPPAMDQPDGGSS